MFSAAGKSAVTSGYNINNSLRLRSSASAYLSRTPASAGNLQKWTYSAWVKRGSIGTGSGFYQNLLDATGSGNVYHNIRFIDDKLTFTLDNIVGLNTNAVFRDPSAWYHVVVVWDTPNATSTDRIIIYVNGIRQAVTVTYLSYPAQNTNGQVNSTNAHAIGRYVYGNAQFFDGHITEINFIDGSALTPSSFGETDGTTGVWKPKKFVGSYGTNGFYLPFSDIATTSGSNAGLGKDFSGNGNYWTTNNISVTAGTTYDAMLDSPTNTSATVANYCVMNPLYTYLGRVTTFTNGNLNVQAGSAAYTPTVGTIAIPNTGKWYFEVTLVSNNGSGNNQACGIRDTTSEVSGNYNLYLDATGSGYIDVTKDGVASGNYGAYSNGQVYQFAIDMDNSKSWIGINNTWLDSGNPSTGSNSIYTPNLNTTYYPYFLGYSSGVSAFNFGQRPFAYTPPTGFNRLNTYNLSDSTIKKGSRYMDATTYTGTGSAQSITNSAGMQPDLVWIKARNAVSYHGLTDSVRGRAYPLFSNATDAEGTSASDKDLTSFNSNGFSLGIGNQYNSNATSNTYVAWQWSAGSGTTTVNTSGSISSNVSVSTTAGFSVIGYTGTGSAGTIGHGLGVAPKMVIVKSRTTAGDEWCVWHTSLTNATYYLYLNSTAGQAVDVNFWNSTAPSSTVITLGSNVRTNRSGGSFICYAWTEIAGFSKFGSYTGNGNANGPFVYLGFRPAYVMIKLTSAAGQEWCIQDSKRLGYNPDNAALFADLTAAEYASNLRYVDFTSNGFKIRNSSSNQNVSGGTYVYMAFAENPFKNALAR